LGARLPELTLATVAASIAIHGLSSSPLMRRFGPTPMAARILVKNPELGGTQLSEREVRTETSKERHRFLIYFSISAMPSASDSAYPRLKANPSGVPPKGCNLDRRKAMVIEVLP
jgi:hypothetical protein